MTDNDQENNKQSPEIEVIEEIVIPGDILDRKKLLQFSSTLITNTVARVSGQRFRPQDGDAQRIAFIKAARDLIALHDALLRGAKSPTFEGIPVKSRSLDPEISAAMDQQMDDLLRDMYDLPRKPGKPVPAKVGQK